MSEVSAVCLFVCLCDFLTGRKCHSASRLLFLRLSCQLFVCLLVCVSCWLDTSVPFFGHFAASRLFFLCLYRLFVYFFVSCTLLTVQTAHFWLYRLYTVHRNKQTNSRHIRHRKRRRLHTFTKWCLGLVNNLDKETKVVFVMSQASATRWCLFLCLALWSFQPFDPLGSINLLAVWHFDPFGP